MRIYSGDQPFNVEATVAQKLNQGTIRKRAIFVFGVLFLVTFFGQAKKVTNKLNKATVINLSLKTIAYHFITLLSFLLLLTRLNKYL